MSVWEPRGLIEFASVSRIVLSPTFERDGCVFVATAAGLSASQDAGSSWKTPALGTLGPFVREVAVSEHADGFVAYAATPAGLFRSIDGGETWALGGQVGGPGGPLAVLPDGTMFCVSSGTDQIWRGSEGDYRFVPLGRIGAVPTDLGWDRTGSALWAVTREGLYGSDDRGESWDAIRLPRSTVCQGLAILQDGVIAVCTEDAGLLLRLPDGSWQEPDELSSLGVTSAAAADNGAVVLAGTEAGVFVSRDGGRRWNRTGPEALVLSLAISSDGKHAYAGFAGGGCWHSASQGDSWEQLRGLRGALVVQMRAGTPLLAVRGVEGACAYSWDDGRHWQVPTLPGGASARDIDCDAAADHVALATSAGLIVDDALLASAPLGDEVAHVACATGPERALAVSGATETFLSLDGGRSWEPAEVAPDEEEITGLAWWRADAAAPPRLVVATVNSREKTASLWLQHAPQSWRRVVKHLTASGAMIHIATVDGPHGIFAAVGDSVYRPARIGVSLFVQEVVLSDSGGQITGLTAARDVSGDAVVVALSNEGVYASTDGGLVWSRLPNPGLPPVTAIGMRMAAGTIELLAARLGGEVIAIQPPRPSR